MEQTPHTPIAEPGTAEFFLEVAERIGRRVARAAEWQGEAATWTIMSPDRERPELRVAKPTTASGTFYEGTSGVAVFLAELHAALGAGPDDELARAALGGIRFALNEAATLPPASFGLHGGRPGIAWAAGVVARRLNRPELLDEAVELLRPMEGIERQDRGIDVIAGGGGAIPPLLQLAEWVKEPEVPRGIAIRLGEALIASAEKETHGWGWGTMRGSAVRHLCGYAHGSAGVAHGLLELWHATGDSRFLYAAEQGFLYERQFFSDVHNNWPDLRHTELGEYLYAGRQEELKNRLLSGDPIPPQPMRYMSAWCHGAPGIGLTRLRAWQLTGDPIYLEEARAAVAATIESLNDPRMNYSLCHGRGGNAETPMVAAEILGEPEHLARPREVAMEGWEEYEKEGRPWPCGTMGGVSDPGLLLGESGVGYFLLRLARPETPSVLFVTAPRGGEPDGGAGYETQRERTVAEKFGRTLHVLQHLGVDPAGVIPGHGPGATLRSDDEDAFDAIEARVAAEPDAGRRALLEDAFRVDRARHELSRAITDFTEEFLETLVRTPEADVRWNETRISLSPRARVVHAEHDWDAWLEQAHDHDHGHGHDHGHDHAHAHDHAHGHGEGGEAELPEPQDTFYLLQATGGARVSARRLSPFAALVLQSVETPATLDEVVSRVEEAVSSPDGGPEREWLEDRVVEQLRQAYRAGFVGTESGVAAAA